MKKLSWLFVLILPLVFVACGEDGDDEPELSNVLQYDGPPFSGPELPFGEHVFAVRFGEEELKDYIGKSLEEVTFYAGEQPEQTSVIIYGEGTNTTPGDELYSANINNLSLPNWNDHVLANPIEITGEDLWLAVKVVHLGFQRSIGCDQGPNVANGDWLFRGDDREWKSFSATTPESVNWNIRGIIGE
ncbi:MAG: hypothetical protein AAF849_07660 [Bacteroidota bacterium]